MVTWAVPRPARPARPPRAERILIVHARDEPFADGPYAVRLLMEHWARSGIVIEVTDRLDGPAGPGVLVFPHFDLTRTPPAYLEPLDRSARVINRGVTDISKRVISRYLVNSPEEHEGAVIVKSNLNFGGASEARLIACRGGPALRKLEAMQNEPWFVSGLFGQKGYQIFAKSSFVPPRAWTNPALVIEKFLPEMEGDHYCLRQHIFLGEREINIRSVGTHPLVKSKNVVRRDLLDAADVPEGVRALREKLGFEFGKFDYVMHEGEAIVFDVSRTPTYDPGSKAGSAGSLIETLAPGIQPFLGPA
jgi:hypothetical protein